MSQRATPFAAFALVSGSDGLCSRIVAATVPFVEQQSSIHSGSVQRSWNRSPPQMRQDRFVFRRTQGTVLVSVAKRSLRGKKLHVDPGSRAARGANSARQAASVRLTSNASSVTAVIRTPPPGPVPELDDRTAQPILDIDDDVRLTQIFGQMCVLAAQLPVLDLSDGAWTSAGASAGSAPPGCRWPARAAKWRAAKSTNLPAGGEKPIPPRVAAAASASCRNPQFIFRGVGTPLWVSRPLRDQAARSAPIAAARAATALRFGEPGGPSGVPWEPNCRRNKTERIRVYFSLFLSRLLIN